MKIISYLIITFLTFSSLSAFSPLDDIAPMEAPTQTHEPVSLPNPGSLNLHWWHYFDVEGDELKDHITKLNTSLLELHKTLPHADQAAALSLITRLNATLQALFQPKKEENSTLLTLFQTKKEETVETEEDRPFLNSYTLEKQLELNLHIRKWQIDLQNETQRRNVLKTRLMKGKQNLDNMVAAYLTQSEPTPKKIMDGLEIMTFRANIALGEQALQAANARLEQLEHRLKRGQEELEFSKEHLHVQDFEERAQEKIIAHAQTELDQKQKKLEVAEANLIGAFQQAKDSHAHSLLEQQALQAAINRSLAWSKLAFQRFKYNVLMHLNERFQGSPRELRDSLLSWRDQISTMHKQIQEWRKTILQEQDRIRQDYTFLVANQSESSQLRQNQTLQQGITQLHTSLDLLQDEISHTEWLIDLLENHFHKTSGFLENWRVSILGALTKASHIVVISLNYSLFKISDIPITLLTLLKIVIIISLAAWLSIFLRKSLTRFGKARGGMTESTLYSFGSLAHYVILLVGFIIALCSIGLDFSNFIFLAGAITFGISLGMQSIANNFFCGLRILFERKLKIGDDIVLHSGHHGKVDEIHVQNTVIRTNDGQKVIIPNAELIGNTLVNWTHQNRDFRRLHIPFSVSPNSDKELVRDVVVEAAKKVPCVLKDRPDYAEPQVWLVSFNSHALEFELVVWVDYHEDSPSDSKEADFIWEIETALRQYQIALPLPTLQQLLAHPHS